MKAKTIKQVLNKKHKEWVESITDETARKYARRDTIITGGCIASMLLREKVNDYDIYFKTKEAVLAITRYYIDQFQKLNGNIHDINIIEEDGRIKIKVKSRDLRPASEPGFQYSDEDDTVTHVEDTSNEELPKYRPVYLSANALTLSNQVQIVIRFYGDAETIHENYDFEHCKCYWVADINKLVLPAPALEALLTKELIYSGSKYPLASIIRTRKFINRGFTINAGQYLKMCLQLNDLDLKDLPTLEDQLIGMDAAYFAMLLAAIPPEKRVNNRIDSSYIMTIINRFF